MRSLDGFSQVLLEDYTAVLDDQGQQYLRRIQANASRMAQLIDDLLDLSRATRVELRRRHTDISALAREVIADLTTQDLDRSVDVDIADGLGAQADPHLVRLVLQNLLSNAWKFTANRRHASISLLCEARDGVDVFTVADDGAGFNMQYAHKLFDPFQRLHSATEYEGTGIGLAIVQRIITRHGGQIVADSRPGGGATFRFSLAPSPPDWKI